MSYSELAALRAPDLCPNPSSSLRVHSPRPRDGSSRAKNSEQRFSVSIPEFCTVDDPSYTPKRDPSRRTCSPKVEPHQVRCRSENQLAAVLVADRVDNPAGTLQNALKYF